MSLTATVVFFSPESNSFLLLSLIPMEENMQQDVGRLQQETLLLHTHEKAILCVFEQCSLSPSVPRNPH